MRLSGFFEQLIPTTNPRYVGPSSGIDMKLIAFEIPYRNIDEYLACIRNHYPGTKLYRHQPQSSKKRQCNLPLVDLVVQYIADFVDILEADYKAYSAEVNLSYQSASNVRDKLVGLCEKVHLTEALDYELRR